MKIIVAGGRDFIPTERDEIELINLLNRLKPSYIVSGMATGADTFGVKVANKLKLTIKKFPAEWNKYGRKAGPLRNIEMAKFSDILIVYPGGRGTKHMILEAEKYNLKIYKMKENFQLSL